MIIVTDNPNHAAIVSHRKPGYLVMKDNSVIKFDELLYFDDNTEWIDQQPPFYYYWNKAENFRSGVSVSNVQYIYFKDDRISEASI